MLFFCGGEMIYIFILILVVLFLFIYSMCKISSQCSRVEEKYEEVERLRKK